MVNCCAVIQTRVCTPFLLRFLEIYNKKWKLKESLTPFGSILSEKSNFQMMRLNKGADSTEPADSPKSPEFPELPVQQNHHYHNFLQNCQICQDHQTRKNYQIHQINKNHQTQQISQIYQYHKIHQNSRVDTITKFTILIRFDSFPRLTRIKRFNCQGRCKKNPVFLRTLS